MIKLLILGFNLTCLLALTLALPLQTLFSGLLWSLVILRKMVNTWNLILPNLPRLIQLIQIVLAIHLIRT